MTEPSTAEATEPVPRGSGGNRLDWPDVPGPVRWALEGFFGSSVVEAVTQPGGFSPGLAARVRLADGRRFFIKAVGTARNPVSPELFRREARVSAALPVSSVVPGLVWSYDDGDWVALVLDDVPGRTPVEPWQAPELARVLAALPGLWAAMTPAPCAAPTVVERWSAEFGVWRTWADDPPPALAARWPWAADHVGLLAELGDQWQHGVVGETLLHGDLRADNVILADDGRVVFVDWPHALTGAAWVDLVFLLPSVAMQGHNPQALFEAHPVAAGVDPAVVTALVAGVAGYFVGSSLLPPPPGLPAVRAFQAAQGRANLAWLRDRLNG